jgi:hypothetical protein
MAGAHSLAGCAVLGSYRRGAVRMLPTALWGAREHWKLKNVLNAGVAALQCLRGWDQRHKRSWQIPWRGHFRVVSPCLGGVFLTLTLCGVHSGDMGTLDEPLVDAAQQSGDLSESQYISRGGSVLGERTYTNSAIYAGAINEDGQVSPAPASRMLTADDPTHFCPLLTVDSASLLPVCRFSNKPQSTLDSSRRSGW